MKSWASETRAAYSSCCRLFPVLLLLLFLAPGPSQAFTLADTRGIGARAMARGGAFTAGADDPSANYYNPAGLVQVNLHDMQIEYLMAFPRVYVQRGSGPREVYLSSPGKTSGSAPSGARGAVRSPSWGPSTSP